MQETSVRRGDIFYADLSPVVGSEQGGMRPVLIVQNDTGNRHSPTVIAAAITSQTGKARLPTHIELSAGGACTELTKNELRILQSLMEKHGRVVSRDELMMRLWQTDSFVDENTLTVNVTRLRKKLENAGLHGFIKTRKGLGYIVDEE